jgi:hypothetical protein
MIEDCPDFKTAFRKVGGYDLQPKNFQDAVKIITDALALLIISKNHKYGKKNINDLGQIGIFCRTYDKTSRLREHFVNKVELGNEDTIDSFADLAGYGVVDLLYEMGWYNLELENDRLGTTGTG